jgi:small-conductance mechanosensitive channel
MFKSIVFTFWVILMALGPPLSFAQESKSPSPPEKPPTSGHPVVLGDQVLFNVQGAVEGLKGLAPEERARGLSEKIKSLAEDLSVSVDSLALSNFQKPMTLIVSGDKLLMVVLDSDAAAAGRSREELAGEFKEKIRTAIAKYRKDRSRESIIYGSLYTLLATLALIAVLILINKLKRKIDQGIESWLSQHLKGLQIQSFEIVRAERMKALLMGTVKTVRIFLGLLFLYVYLELVLGFFPRTKPIADRVLDYVLSPLTTIGRGILDQIPNLLFITILVLIARYILKVMKVFFLGVEKGTLSISGFYPEWARSTYRILSILVVTFFVVVAYPYIPGSDSLAFKGISVFLGILFSLGSQSSVANIIAGFTLTYRRAFKVGDRVKIADFTGDVLETRLQVTTLRTIKNEEIVVPNSLIMNSHVINYSTEAREKGLILHTTVTIGYDAPWRKVHELLLKAAERTPGLLREPAPFVLQSSLDDFYVTYELNAHTDNPQEMVRLYSDLHQNIQDAFNEGGVEIMSPHYTQVRDGNKAAIPESYLPKDYVPGGLRIQQTGNKEENRKPGRAEASK